MITKTFTPSAITKAFALLQRLVYCYHVLSNNMNTVAEIFKPINNYIGLYAVSNLGNIKSLERYVLNRWKGKKKIVKERVLKFANSNGYLRVNLCKKNRSKMFSAHRLVAQAFLGLDIEDSKTFVCHHDDNPLNNCVDNLFIGTPKENTRDMMGKGRLNSPKGEKQHCSKLKHDQVIEIKRLLNNGYKVCEICEMFNMSKPAISDIKSGKTWKHL